MSWTDASCFESAVQSDAAAVVTVAVGGVGAAPQATANTRTDGNKTRVPSMPLTYHRAMPSKQAKSKKSGTFAAPIPILRSFDEKKAKEFYVGFLGFTLDFEHRFEKNTPLYMQVSKDGCRIQISEHFGDGTPGTKLKIETGDLASYHRALNAKKYRNARPGLHDREWGEREMPINNPFGNTIIFFEKLPRR